MIKVVLDTNTILSGSVFGGMAEAIIDLIIENKLQFFTSTMLVKEILEKLDEFKVNESIFTKTMIVLEIGKLVVPDMKITVCRDPKDNFVLELAETAQADFIITRDKDLLELKNHRWKNTQIVKPEEFLPFLRSKKLLN